MSERRRTWTIRIGVTAALWFAGTGVLYWFGTEPRPGLIALVVAGGTVVLWLFLDALGENEPPRWRLPPADWPVRPPGDDPRLAFLHRLVLRHLDAREVGDNLQEHLLNLADHRLVATHGISLRADPDRAEPFVGAELAALAAGAGRGAPRRMSVAQIDVLLKRIEAL
jgi:hypothetical protein